VALSGRVTEVTAWREGWAAVLESCTTEIGLAAEVRVFISVDANHDKLTFLVSADGPSLSWHRDQIASAGRFGTSTQPRRSRRYSRLR
jgi:hypothetical protein